MEVVLLGTASAGGSAVRDNTYFLLRRGQGSVLVDVGGDPLGKLKRLNVPLDDIEQVVFTHFHIDHIYGLPSLLWGMWLGGRTKPLTLHCSTGDRERLQRWLDVLEVKKWPVAFDIHIVTYEWRKETVLVSDQNLYLSTFPSQHVGETVGLKLVHNDQVLMYSADTMPNERIKREPKIDVLIHEATTAEKQLPHHTSLNSIIQYYEMEQIDKVVLVHLTDGEPYEAVLKRATPAVRQKVTLGFDFMNISM